MLRTCVAVCSIGEPALTMASRCVVVGHAFRDRREARRHSCLGSPPQELDMPIASRFLATGLLLAVVTSASAAFADPPSPPLPRVRGGIGLDVGYTRAGRSDGPMVDLSFRIGGRITS